MHKKELLIFIVIILVASFFRLYHLSSIPPGLYPDEAINGNDAVQANELHRFLPFYKDNNGREGLLINLIAITFKLIGVSIFSLRFVSAIAGIATVIGLYLLVREMFQWRVAAIASFFLAVSFWHVNFSRISFAGVLAPMCFVYTMYFLWCGLRKIYFADFIYAGIFLGLGFYTYIAFRIMPLAILVTLAAYWYAVRKDFDAVKYRYTRNKVLWGILWMAIVAIIVVMPLAIYFLQNPGTLAERASQVSILSSQHILQDLISNIIKTAGMFNFYGDYNWRHNISGMPMLFWPIGALFAIGLIKSCLKLFRIYKSHRHFSTVQVFLLSWFIIALMPEILSNEGIPHALRSIIAVPVAMIFAAEGLWWIFETFDHWYEMRDQHSVRLGVLKMTEHGAIAGLSIIVLLTSIGIAEYFRYFRDWAQNPITADAFNYKYVQLGNRLNALPRQIIKYVYVNADGILVNGIPMPAQTVMFITDTATPEKQKEKNIYYLTKEQYNAHEYNKRSMVFPLEPLI